MGSEHLISVYLLFMLTRARATSMPSLFHRTALGALAVCTGLQPDSRKKQRYLAAMLRYANFVVDGCVTAPTHPDVGHGKKVECPPKGGGWVITSGPDAGAIGDGWDSGRLDTGAYTISTARVKPIIIGSHRESAREH